MKTEELTAIGLSDEQANQVLAINGKDIEKHKQRITALEGERDNYKSQFETAEETLKKFEGIDPEKVKDEIQDWKDKAEAAKKDFELRITQRDQKDWINQKLDEYGVSSPYARKQLISECTAEDSGLSWKDGAFFGFDDFMKSAKEKDNGLYQTAEEKKAAEEEAKKKENAPNFTDRIESGNGSGSGNKKFVPPSVF
ncbi:MAG: phage scaffolding protein [Ruminococcus sp.]|nr:phage scaffolding protein [Ruminococcus sp.]